VNKKSHLDLLEDETKGHSTCIYECLMLMQNNQCGVNYSPYVHGVP
jgi:hypothetical protein